MDLTEMSLYFTRRCRNFTIFWCLIASTLFFSAGVGAANRKINLFYEISWGALHLATATSEWDIQDGKALILGSIKSDGVASLFSGFESVSSAEISSRDNLWQPQFLSLLRKTKSKKISSFVLWSEIGKLLSDDQQPALDLSKVFPIPENLKEGVIDPYSAVLRQIDYIVKNDQCGEHYSIYDGLRRFDVQFQNVGRRYLVADRPFSFEGPALLCKFLVVPKGGHRIKSRWNEKPSEKRTVKVFFGRFDGDLFIPVRIEVEALIGTGVARLDIAQSRIPDVLAR